MTETCAVVPVFNHEHAVGGVVAGLRAAGLPCLLVDDGSSHTCAAALDALAKDPLVSVLHLPHNLGKGGAVAAGLREAAGHGYSHALQIDADGQHDVRDIPRFLRASRDAPDSVICGRPEFDASIPRIRHAARYLTHAMVWLNTLSFEVRDSMCGFRIYPLETMTTLLAEEPPGLRMDFDIEVLVRLHWRGVPMEWLDTRVSYPHDGVSHFRLGLDNLLITRMHARLFFGMLHRLPRILGRRLRGNS